MTSKSYLLISLFVFIINELILSQDYDKMKRFADELTNNSEYYRAITEYYRINSYFPENPDFLNNLCNIARCYNNAEHKIEAIQVYKKILDIDKTNWYAVYNTAKAYHDISYFYESNTHILSHKDNFQDEKRDSLFMGLAVNWIYLGFFSKADSILNFINTDNLLKERANRYINYIHQETPIKFKRKSAAVFLSIIPGGGYFYTQRIQTGFSAFIVNLLFGYATYESFRKNQNGLGIATSLFSVSFYLGSLYGSIQAVGNYNNDLMLKFSKKFQF